MSDHEQQQHFNFNSNNDIAPWNQTNDQDFQQFQQSARWSDMNQQQNNFDCNINNQGQRFNENFGYDSRQENRLSDLNNFDAISSEK